jgi:hypothetical protein
MFRCESCGSGFSARAASSWESCPRCLAKDGTKVPLSFELGWRRATDGETSPGEARESPSSAIANTTAATG